MVLSSDSNNYHDTLVLFIIANLICLFLYPENSFSKAEPELKVKDCSVVDYLFIKCWFYCVCLWMRRISLLLDSEACHV